MTSNSERWKELATEPEENSDRVKKKRNWFETGRDRNEKRQNDFKGIYQRDHGGKGNQQMKYGIRFLGSHSATFQWLSLS